LTIQTRPAVSRLDYPSRDAASSERDRLLVQAHLNHDPDAFSIIVDDHWDALICQARRMLGPNGAAEDVMQETFERALKYINRFGRTGEYRLGAWLNQILRSVIQSHWERTAREVRGAEATANERDIELDVADQVGDPIIAQALRNRIRDLPENQRAAFVMREVIGLPYADVARALNVSEENVRARVSRSKGRLRRSTEGLRSALGALIAAPFGWRAFDRDKSHVGTGDQVVTQVTASPLGQTVMSLASVAVPRGSLVFGIAATVATVGAGTALLTGTDNHGPIVTAHLAPVAQLAPPSIASTASLATAPAVAGTGGLSASSNSYGWVNAGTGSTSSLPIVGLPIAACTLTDGSGSMGNAASPALGLSNALSVAIGAPLDLPSVGPSMSFTSFASMQTFGEGAPSSSAVVVTDACVSSSAQWFSATVSGAGGSVTLHGMLVQVLGSGGDVSYIFRGTIAADGGLSGPLAGAVQFVADLTVLEPANTAQLTIVFLSADPVPSAPSPGSAASVDPAIPSAAPDAVASQSTGSSLQTSGGQALLVDPTLSTQLNQFSDPALSNSVNQFGSSITAQLLSGLGGHGDSAQSGLIHAPISSILVPTP